MKKFIFVIILVVAALLASGVIAANENGVFLPIVYGGPTLAPPTETPVFTETPTLTPEVVEPTATTTPDSGDGYTWVFVGDAYKDRETEETVIWGHKPGYCYDLEHNKVEKTIYLEAVKIPESECDRDSYNPAAPWPPPEFPPPPSLPPEFDYGHIYKLVLDINAKVVCSVYFPANCVNVR